MNGFDQIKGLGGEVIMSKTGHSHVKNNLKKFKAHLAGEMSGHIFFADNYKNGAIIYFTNKNFCIFNNRRIRRM